MLYSTYRWKAYGYTIALPKFVACAFHGTRLSPLVAYHSLFLLSRLKSKYPATSCTFGHRLLLTSYMLYSKVICDDTYSNKVSVSYAENHLRATTNRLILQLTHVRPRIIRAPQRQLDGMEDDPLPVARSHHLRTRWADHRLSDKAMPMPVSTPSTPVTVDSHLSTSSDSPPSYTTYPKDDRDSFISPIRTPHLIPLANRHRRRLVPRLHPTKTLVCRRHQEASSSASNLSAPHRTSK